MCDALISGDTADFAAKVKGMNVDEHDPLPDNHATVASISRALKQSEHVQDMVNKAALDLSSVNTTLKNELDDQTLAKVEMALDRIEAAETRVHEAATELAAVNEVLAEEIDERHALERRLSHSAEALSVSRALARQARHAALHDAGTGLPNLTLFQDRFATALAHAQRYSGRLAVLFVDVDEFKHVNDTHGHDIGDRMLQVIAQCLQASIRAGDTLSRRGGDEFLILALEADAASAAAVVARIRKGMAQTCTVDGVTLALSVSIGVALYPEHGTSAKELLKHADMAMYAAKAQRAISGPA